MARKIPISVETTEIIKEKPKKKDYSLESIKPILIWVFTNPPSACPYKIYLEKINGHVTEETVCQKKCKKQCEKYLKEKKKL